MEKQPTRNSRESGSRTEMFNFTNNQRKENPLQDKTNKQKSTHRKTFILLLEKKLLGKSVK